MFLVQLLLPLRDNGGEAFGRAEFDRVKDELAERFGGATAFLRSPALGAWQETDGQTTHDDIVIFEAMADSLDRAWWAEYRRDLERRFRQEDVIVRASRIEKL